MEARWFHRLAYTLGVVLLVGAPAVIAADEPADAAPEPEVKLKYDNGFGMVTSDGRFSLKLNGGIQFRYTYVDFDEEVVGNEENFSNFYMRRARLWFKGHAFDPRVTYFIHLQLEPHRTMNAHDIYLEYELADLARLGVGRNKVPYGLEFMSSGFGLNLVDRSVMYGETDIDVGGGAPLYPGGGTALLRNSWIVDTGFATGGLSLYRSQGVWLRGRRGSASTPAFEYQTGIWQGRGSAGLSNRADDHLFTVRLGYHPWGFVDPTLQGDGEASERLKVGVVASAYRSSSELGGGFDDTGYNLGVESRWRGLSVDAEWGCESFDFDAFAEDFNREGWRAVAGYFVLPARLELVARYAEIERLNDPTVARAEDSGLGVAQIHDDDQVVIGLERRISEITFGANIFLNDWHRHKVQVDVSRLLREFAADPAAGVERAPDQLDYRLRAMVQLYF